MILGIIQIRSQSSRFSNKCKELIGNKSLFEHCLERCFQSTIDYWLILNPMNDPEREWIKKTALNYGAGRVCVPDVHYDDVLQGFVRAIDCVENTLQEEVSWVVRITSDCWNIDPYIIDSVLGFCEQTGIPMTQQFFEASTVQCYRKVDYQRGDRELTGDIRNDACEGFRKGFEKGSIDNREDLEKARRIYENAI